jgi:hypothetical protein
MARQKYYAVRVGRGGPKIYTNWDDVCFTAAPPPFDMIVHANNDTPYV